MFKLYCFISTIINVADMAVLETHSRIFSWRGRSARSRAGLPLRLEERSDRSLVELSKDKHKVLQAPAATRAGEWTDWERPGFL